MGTNKHVYLVRYGDAAIRAYTSQRQLLNFLKQQEPHILWRILIQRLEIGDVEQGINIKAAPDVLALWEKSKNA